MIRLTEAIGLCYRVLPRRLQLGWLALPPIAVLVAALESLGALMVFGLIGLMADPGLFETSAWGRWLAGQFGAGAGAVQAFALALAVFYVCKNALALLLLDLRNRMVTRSAAFASTGLLRVYLAAPYSSHLRRSTAELVRNMTASVELAYRQVMGSAVAAGTEVAVALGLTLLLLQAGPLTTLVILIALTLLLWLGLKLTQRRFSRWGLIEQQCSRTALQTIQQVLSVFKEVKVLGRQQYFVDRFAAVQDALVRVRRRTLNWLVAPRYLVESVFTLGMLLIIVVLARNADNLGESLALLALYAYVGFRMIPSFNRILEQAGALRNGTGAVHLLREDLQRIAAGEASLGPGDEAPRVTPAPFTERLTLDAVEYSFPEHPSPVLEQVTITIERGQSLGIVGATGSGKSTLLDLVLGLRHPSAGRVLADGHDIHDNLAGWQRNIGYVPQEVTLIDDDLRSNVALGVPDGAIDDDRIWEVLELAQLAEFVRELADGLVTMVGERGVRLSGGQRQRVAIARALYHRPELLVLDEATSALDAETEREVTRAIRSLHGRNTVLVVAHRLSTVRDCDWLIGLEHGRIAFRGRFDALLRDQPAFRRLVGSEASPPVESG